MSGAQEKEYAELKQARDELLQEVSRLKAEIRTGSSNPNSPSAGQKSPNIPNGASTDRLKAAGFNVNNGRPPATPARAATTEQLKVNNGKSQDSTGNSSKPAKQQPQREQEPNNAQRIVERQPPGQGAKQSPPEVSKIPTKQAEEKQSPEEEDDAMSDKSKSKASSKAKSISGGRDVAVLAGTASMPVAGYFAVAACSIM